MNPRLQFILRLGITAALVVLIVVRVDWSSVAGILGAVSVTMLATAFAIKAIGIVLSAFKWGLLLEIQGTALPLATLVRYYLVGMFANNFMPTIVGGDAARAYQTARRTGDGWGAGASILMERLTGLTGLLAVGIWAWTASAARIGGFPFWLPIVAGLAAGAAVPAAGALLLRSIAIGKGAVGWRSSLLRLKEVYRRSRKRLLASLALSVLFHLLMGLGTWVLVRALGSSPRLIDVTWVVPAVSLLTMIPVSLNGYGLRETGYIVLLGSIGVPEAGGAAAALLSRAILIVFSTVGGVLLLGRFPLWISSPRPAPEETP